MGCQADKEHLPSFHVLLTRTSLKSIDDFYEEVERTITKIQSLSESVEIVIDKFASATGIYGPPNRSVAFGLLGLVVALRKRYLPLSLTPAQWDEICGSDPDSPAEDDDPSLRKMGEHDDPGGVWRPRSRS